MKFIVLNKSATDVTDDEGDEDVVSPEVPVEGDEQEEVDEEVEALLRRIDKLLLED